MQNANIRFFFVIRSSEFGIRKFFFEFRLCGRTAVRLNNGKLKIKY